MNNFAQTFKHLRINKQLTQGEIAKKLKLSKSTISMYENGKRTPDFETFKLIADYFNVSLDFLIGRNTIVNSFSELVSESSEIYTVAAHAMKDLTKKEQEKVLEFIKFQKMQRKND